MKKWNYEKNDYEEYKVPDDWYCPLIEDMDVVINCAQCGKSILYSEGYSSQEIHTDRGLAFSVCDHCSTQEFQRQMKYKNRVRR